MSNPRKPKSLKLIQGTFRKDRAVNGDQAPRGAPPRPEWMNADALAAWDTIVASVAELGLLSPVDSIALQCFAAAVADMHRARRVCEEKGYTWTRKSADGSVMHRLRPEYGQLVEAERRILAWSLQFGLTPLARTRLSIDPKPQAPNKFTKLGLVPPDPA